MVIERAAPLPCQDHPLRDARGCRLAEEVTADSDQPPFTRSLVDGFALNSADHRQGTRRFRLGETIVAGRMPTRAIEPGEAAAIMTGAPCLRAPTRSSCTSERGNCWARSNLKSRTSRPVRTFKRRDVSTVAEIRSSQQDLS